MKTFDRKAPKAQMLLVRACDGGCGMIERAHRASVRDAAYYVCSLRCEAKLPVLPFGFLRVSNYNAFGTLTGITDRDPTSAERSAIGKSMAQLGISPDQIGNLDL